MAVPDTHIAAVPDWVREILSPSTARKDRKLKLPLYRELGVQHAWLVDPQARTLEILRNDGAHWIVQAVFGDQDARRAEPFDAAEIALGPLWDG